MSSAPTLNGIVAGEIRAEMARQRKTGVDLAHALHCSQQSASRRLTGQTPLTLDELAAIAEWLSVPVSVFTASRREVA